MSAPAPTQAGYTPADTEAPQRNRRHSRHHQWLVRRLGLSAAAWSMV